MRVMKVKPFIPARLKVRTEEGAEFVETARVLRETELQDRCLEKRELKRIVKILRRLEMWRDPRLPKSPPLPGRITVSKSSKRDR